MIIPEFSVPVMPLAVDAEVQLYLKREDLIHPHISGNKYWKLFYNINTYLQQQTVSPLIVTFGGAFSNHIAAVAALGKEKGIKTFGIIRGEELALTWRSSPTLHFAHEQGMEFRFATRDSYRQRELLTSDLKKEFPHALLLPEGGTNPLAVEGVRHMLTPETKRFDYLCTAVGTGGTVAGISRFAGEDQKVLGFTVVRDSSLEDTLAHLSGRKNFSLCDAAGGGYGKISDGNVRFINWFSARYGIPLDPIYTGKMMEEIFRLIKADFFPRGAQILAFHTGGLQGIAGANALLSRQNRTLIDIFD